MVKVWRCEVDIAAVARTCSEWPLLLAFLQRRHPAAHPACDIKALLLTIVKVPPYLHMLLNACFEDQSPSAYQCQGISLVLHLMTSNFQWTLVTGALLGCLMITAIHTNAVRDSPQECTMLRESVS